jgi:hypothetical protein
LVLEEKLDAPDVFHRDVGVIFGLARMKIFVLLGIFNQKPYRFEKRSSPLRERRENPKQERVERIADSNVESS